MATIADIKANLHQEAATAQAMAEGVNLKSAAIILVAVGGKYVASVRTSDHLTLADVQGFLEGLDDVWVHLLAAKRKLQPRR